MSSTYLNERSWAIDLIVHINQYLNDRTITIKRAGGERSIRGETTLFPDVLLFGDERAGQILQGWELKLPDTRVTDENFIQNAKDKARYLSLDSFLLWNVNKAVLYVDKNGKFKPKNNWHLGKEIEREDVEDNELLWKELAIIIIRDLDGFFEDGTLTGKNLIKTFSEGLPAELIRRNFQEDVKALKEKARASQQFRSELNLWWHNVEKIYPAKSDKWEILTKTVLISWINKFLFGHTLKLSQQKARILNRLENDTSMEEVIGIFRSLSEQCDFWNIFKESLGERYISNTKFNLLLQFNSLLSEFNIEKIDQNIIKETLRTTTENSRLKAAGQFVTPAALADLLTRLTLADLNKPCYDPFCGTGTIVKSAYELKVESGIDKNEAIGQVYGSDKFAFPTQIATIALSEPENLGAVIRIFQLDALELEEDLPVTFYDPNTGDEIHESLPKFHYICSNLPFVQFEHLHETNETVARINERITALTDQEVRIAGRSDLYAYLPFYLWTMLKDRGRLGIIVSNAWLGTKWGRSFRNILRSFFNIRFVITSSEGRWFSEAKVVTNILILEKKEVSEIDKDETINFVTLKKSLPDISTQNLGRIITSHILLENENDDYLSLNQYKNDRIAELEGLGMISWNSLFSDINWITDFSDVLEPVTTFFEVARGERRGWDAMFFPEEGHGIEDDYIENCLKTLKNTEYLEAIPDTEAFCCSLSEDELKDLGHTGALNWIDKFRYETNNVDVPLPDSLARTNHHWYEMKPDTMADMTLSLNPDKRLFFALFQNRAFVNQRAIRFTKVDEDMDIELMHALLNSILGLFYIEASGFGRGLGALDITPTKLKESLWVLDPSGLSEEDRHQIKHEFKPLLERKVKPLPEELHQEDRIFFDRTVLEKFGKREKYYHIKKSLLELFNMRQTVR